MVYTVADTGIGLHGKTAHTFISHRVWVIKSAQVVCIISKLYTLD